MSQKERTTILIADDHPLFREALQRVVADVLADHAFAEVDNLDSALAAVSDENFELIFLDLNMPGMDGFNGLVCLRNQAPSVPIIVVSANEDPATMREAITYGASGFLPKSLSKEQMAAAVRTVLDGGVYAPAPACGSERQFVRSDAALADSIVQLSHQQRIVLQMLVSGRPNKQIAYELNIVESTVKAHVSAILRKLKVHSRTQAVLKAGKILTQMQDPSFRSMM
jgi:DNA-binding NarL/FixJ family response regulator